MEVEHFSNDNLVIIEQDDDSENEPNTKPIKKMKKTEKGKSDDKNREGEVHKNLNQYLPY